MTPELLHKVQLKSLGLQLLLAMLSTTGRNSKKYAKKHTREDHEEGPHLKQ